LVVEVDRVGGCFVEVLVSAGELLGGPRVEEVVDALEGSVLRRGLVDAFVVGAVNLDARKFTHNILAIGRASTVGLLHDPHSVHDASILGLGSDGHREPTLRHVARGERSHVAGVRGEVIVFGGLETIVSFPSVMRRLDHGRQLQSLVVRLVILLSRIPPPSSTEFLRQIHSSSIERAIVVASGERVVRVGDAVIERLVIGVERLELVVSWEGGSLLVGEDSGVVFEVVELGGAVDDGVAGVVVAVEQLVEIPIPPLIAPPPYVCSFLDSSLRAHGTLGVNPLNSPSICEVVDLLASGVDASLLGSIWVWVIL
jgi:hypothetical protein